MNIPLDPETPLYKTLSLMKEHDLIEQVWIVSSMNKISKRFMELGATKMVIDPMVMDAGLIRYTMETAIDHFVENQMNESRKNSRTDNAFILQFINS